MQPKTLKVLTLIVATLAIAGQLMWMWHFYTAMLPVKTYSTIKFVGLHIQFVTQLTLSIISILIVTRSPSTNAYYLALAVATYALLGQVPAEKHPVLYFTALVLSVFISVLLIIAMQHFPVKVGTEKINRAVKWRWLNWYLKKLLHPRAGVWMLLVLVVISLAEYLFSIADALSTLVVLFTAFAYIYVNFRTTTGVNHARILWLFWGLGMFLLTNLIYYSFYIYAGKPEEGVRIIFVIILLIIIFVSFVMSLFFANTFNTGVFVRRSMVNTILFLLIVFLYNTIEHYVLHWISHTLHVSDVVISSMLSGLLVLCINPLHHRLTHFLTKKLKSSSSHEHV